MWKNKDKERSSRPLNHFLCVCVCFGDGGWEIQKKKKKKCVKTAETEEDDEKGRKGCERFYKQKKKKGVHERDGVQRRVNSSLV